MILYMLSYMIFSLPSSGLSSGENKEGFNPVGVTKNEKAKYEVLGFFYAVTLRLQSQKRMNKESHEIQNESSFCFRNSERKRIMK